jgi:hypothetical protein
MTAGSACTMAMRGFTVAQQEKDFKRKGDVRISGNQTEEQTRCQKAVVQTLISGQSLHSGSLLCRETKDTHRGWPRPQEHLQHQKIDMLNGDKEYEKCAENLH